MSRLKAMSAKSADQSRSLEQATFLPMLCHRIKDGLVIPIISADVFYEQLFDMDGDGVLGISRQDGNSSCGLSLEEQLADAWAEGMDFPLRGRHRLARVALYNRVVNRPDDLSAKSDYLNWLKWALLLLAEDDPDVDSEAIEEQRHRIEQSSFVDIAAELGYPHPVKGQPDALAQLARLNLPIYVTTSYFDFLERAIMANGRTPRTQVCFWSGNPLRYLDESHRPDPSFHPSPENPLVYHLFGLEAYPSSLVLTEDDYLDFLAAIVQDLANQTNALLPLYLRDSLTRSSLILLGYQLHNWDFRILFRGVIKAIPALEMVNLAIQLNPETEQQDAPADKIKNYLKGYFLEKEKKLNFAVEYSSMAAFVTKLCEEWEQWRRR